MSPVLEVHGLTRAFGRRVVLDRLELSIAPGEFVALLGRSGSGKSTLLRVLAGLDAVPAGVARLPQRRAVVFQEPRLMPWKTVAQNVALGLRRDDAEQAARAALAEVGLAARADAWPITLSGGEAQRAALARALVRQPELLLLDEPFAALDALTRIRMHALVGDLWRAHRPAILLVTHDVREAVLLADRVLILESGQITHQTAVSAAHPRRHGDLMLAALEAGLLARLGVEQALTH
ncbi:ATP-binding cassette domain-containing protein [Pseudoroseomonas wenyumeiae]|uniref:ABC transporter ATP-binding protein n=1 Tax=Teichococcus wenyumeiae TaxID=2478470 RepID=A0A3A9JHF8_9PROT|nr:ABC transporter ATP-binding protein [Pseudoroseomonas wenyumeiae]RKK04751.1 ABC transporter ATP-binding protein [Pseudoroseomonas wenyumeiae]RMI26975.1 ATP-binding cassette domain-containing protein [Pseudoroseomonas wenyumeiae]